jgi:hypothetical protein
VIFFFVCECFLGSEVPRLWDVSVSVRTMELVVMLGRFCPFANAIGAGVTFKPHIFFVDADEDSILSKLRLILSDYN